MTPDSTYEFDPRLLDLHLGHLSDAEQIELRARLDADAALHAQHEALAAVFRALRSEPPARMPADLVDRTVQRVVAAGAPPRLVRPADELTRQVEKRETRVVRLGNLREIISLAAMIVLAIGVGVPSMLHLRDRQQRLGCSWNLAQLGRGVQAYANAFGSSLPFTGWLGQRSSWRETDAPGVETVRNRRHVYPLLQLSFVVDPRLFICPSQQHVPMPIGAVGQNHDFLEDRNVSYPYQNMAGVRPSIQDNPDIPILADENPLFAEGRPLFDMRRLGWGDPLTVNSRAHGGAGQNILTIGGHVKFVRTPLAGVDGDNIWTLRDAVQYTGQEGPNTPTDSHLLK